MQRESRDGKNIDGQRDGRREFAQHVGVGRAGHEDAVGARVGIDAWQEYTLLDSNGNQVSKVNTKPDVFIGAGLEVNF